MPTIYHLMLEDDTIIFLSEDDRRDFISGAAGDFIECESTVTDEQFARIESWRWTTICDVCGDAVPESAIHIDPAGQTLCADCAGPVKES